MHGSRLPRVLASLLLPLPISAPAQDADALQRQLANPVSGLAGLPFQYTGMARAAPGVARPGAAWRHTLDIQPVYPLRLTPRWNLINRAVLPVLSNPGPLGRERKTGIGDLTYEAFFTPSEPSRRGWIWGVGPTLTLDTASNDLLGQGKYAAGPAAVVVRAPDAWTYGALVTQSWSFGGADDHPSVSSFQLQPIASYRLSPRHTIGYTGTITADWHRSGGQRWTVPLGITWSTLSRPASFVPVNTVIGAGYNVVRTDRSGTWFVRFQLNFILSGH